MFDFKVIYENFVVDSGQTNFYLTEYIYLTIFHPKSGDPMT